MFNKDIDLDGELDECQPLTSEFVLGEPANPLALLPVGVEAPVMGETFEAFIDHSDFVPNASLDLMSISIGQLNIPTQYGTVIANIPTPITLVGAPGEPIAVPIPYSTVLYGVPLTFQGMAYDPAAPTGQDFRLANAIVAPVAGWRVSH